MRRAELRIGRDPLWAPLMEFEENGAYDDEATGLRGVRRLALTTADAGLEVRIDRLGNVHATRPRRIRSLPSVFMGSPIDTVATGGAFDAPSASSAGSR